MAMWSYSDVVVDRSSLNVTRVFFVRDFLEFSALDGVGSKLFQHGSCDLVNTASSEVSERRIVRKMHGVEELKFFV
jgi:hypothetical protein